MDTLVIAAAELAKNAKRISVEYKELYLAVELVFGEDCAGTARNPGISLSIIPCPYTAEQMEGFRQIRDQFKELLDFSYPGMRLRKNAGAYLWPVLERAANMEGSAAKMRHLIASQRPDLLQEVERRLAGTAAAALQITRRRVLSAGDITCAARVLLSLQDFQLDENQPTDTRLLEEAAEILRVRGGFGPEAPAALVAAATALLRLYTEQPR